MSVSEKPACEPMKVHVTWERLGNCLWHSNCPDRGMFRIDRKEADRSLLHCVACGVNAWAPHGIHDKQTVAVPAEPTPTAPSVEAAASEGDLLELIGEYWDIAYAEGKEGRDHDTEDGAAQRKLAEITAAIRRLSGQGDVQRWQPIETAPKDGTHILIGRPNERFAEDRAHVVRWDDDWWQVHDGKFDHPLRGVEPTLWMPLAPFAQQPASGESHE